MGKRISLIIFPLLISGLVILGYFLHRERGTLVNDPYMAVLPNASIIIETADFKSFLNSVTTGKGLSGEAEKIKEWESFNRKIKFLTDQINKPEFMNLMNEDAAVISFHPGEKENLLTLISVAVPTQIRTRHLKEILNSSGIKEITEDRINGNTLLKMPYTVNNTNDTIFVSLISGLLLCSNSLNLIEESINQTRKNTDVRDLQGFSRVFLASGKNEDKIFVVFANLQKLLDSILGKEGAELAEKISGLAGASGGDIFINEDGLVINGYTESADTSGFLYKFKSLPSKTFHTYKVLPASTVLFETMILPDEQPVRETGNPASEIKSLISDEITRAVIDVKNNTFEENYLFIYELINRVEAEHAFLKAFGRENEILYYSSDDQVRIPVYRASLKMDGFTPANEDLYFTFYDNFMISGRSFLTISSFLYDNLLNKTLSNDLTFRDFESTLPSRGGYFFYCIPSKITGFLGGFLNNDIKLALNSNKISLNKIQAAGGSLSSSNDMIYNSISIRFKEKAEEESTTEWETLLDTVAGIKPFFFKNHITGAKEIFIQDLNNNIYLINSAGRVLWKIALNEKIPGSVYMIDYYRNGKYQLLFAGRNFIHLIDRNGNYVERYPVRLRSAATNSLALFDYDNNLEYRLFIAGEDRLIYSYDKTGNVVKGWKPFKTAGTVRSEMIHLRISGKDYIVVSDETSLYFLDRKGNKRINLQQPVKKAAGSAIRLNPGSKPSVVCSSPDGKIQHIYFDGSVKTSSLKEFSSNHWFDFFDIDGDGFGEYIFIDGNTMYLYDHNFKEKFSKIFDSSVLDKPMDFIFSSSDRKIGIFDNTNKLIYLIDKEGKTLDGFPLRGASLFSIGKLLEKSDWNLIVGGTDRFLYNYKINTELNNN